MECSLLISLLMPLADLSSDEEYNEDEDVYFSISMPLRTNRRDAEGASCYAAGDEPITSTETKKDIFHKAAEQGNLKVMDTLLKEGVTVDESEENEWTPLMKACSRGNSDAVEFLIDRGADPNAVRDNFTPLMACCICSYVQEEGRLECVKYLLRHGADVNGRDKYGSTALMMASGSGLDGIVSELLLKPDIDVNIRDHDGWNALYFAVNHNYKNIVLNLLDAGISCKADVHKDLTPLQLATSKGFVELAEILTPGSVREGGRAGRMRQLIEPILDFLNEMPDEKGEGGFCNDVRGIFVGLGLEKLYDRCEINVSMHDFLLMGEELDKLGIELEPLRWKILTQGIHRYHVYPWKRSSLHVFDRHSEFTFEDGINCLANVTKHLSVMCATLKYLKLRTPKRIMGNNSINKEVITSLVNSYVEINQIQKKLIEIMEETKKIRPVGEKSPDLIEPQKSGHKRFYRGLVFASCVAATAAFYYYKLN